MTITRPSTLWLVSLLALAGCGWSPLGPGMALTAAEAQGRVRLSRAKCGSCSWWHDEFYIVRPEQLSRIRKAKTLTYLGTQRGLHFFRSWNKMLKKNEIDHVAVHTEHCEVSAPLRLDAEEERPGRRRVELRDAQCIVR